MNLQVCLQCKNRCQEPGVAVNIYRNRLVFSLPGDIEGYIRSIFLLSWSIPQSFYCRANGTIKQDANGPLWQNNPCAIEIVVTKESLTYDCDKAEMDIDDPLLPKIFDYAKAPSDGSCPFLLEHTIYDFNLKAMLQN